MEIYKKAILLNKTIKKLNISYINLLLPTFFAVIASVSEGVFVATLVPVINGMLSNDFTAFFLKLKSIKLFGLTDYLSANNSKAFIFLVSIILLSLFVKNIFIFFSKVYLSKTLRKSINETRQYLFGEFLNCGKAFFDKVNAGQLQNALINYLNIIGGQLVRLQNALTEFLILVVYFIVMLGISWEMTLPIVIIFPLLYFSYLWLFKKISLSSRRYAVSQAALNRKIFNILSCIPLIKSYTSEEKEKVEFGGISDRIQEIEYGLDKKQGFYEPSQEVLLYAIILFIVCGMYVGAAKYNLNNIGVYVAFLYILKRASGYFKVFNTIKTVIAYVSGMTDEIMGLLKNKELYKLHDGKIELGSIKSDIIFDNVQFSYSADRTPTALNNMTFTIKKGAKTAIVGESGSGKSTIINLLLRFYDVSGGRITLDGRDIREYTLLSLRRKIALVSQDTYLFNETLAYNILYGLERSVNNDELSRVLKAARLQELVNKLPNKLDTLIGDRGVNLSGGEKQRIAIARAMLKKAEVLILDEATSSLDANNEKMIQEAFLEVVEGKTVISIAHRLATIKSADKIIVIKNGRFIEEGTLNTLLSAKGKFYEYWEQQKFY